MLFIGGTLKSLRQQKERRIDDLGKWFQARKTKCPTDQQVKAAADKKARTAKAPLRLGGGAAELRPRLAANS